MFVEEHFEAVDALARKAVFVVDAEEHQAKDGLVGLLPIILRDVDGIDGGGVGVGVWEFDGVGGDGGEGLAEAGGEGFVGGIVGPEGEGAAGI